VKTASQSRSFCSDYACLINEATPSSAFAIANIRHLVISVMGRRSAAEAIGEGLKMGQTRPSRGTG
jgi:hypothetical protein